MDDQGQPYMVASYSRTNNEHERKYPAYKGETMAAVSAVRIFRPYLHGRRFTLCTDHRPLLYLMQTPQPTGQQKRWILSLMEHDFEILHVAGKLNPADAASCTPLPYTADASGARMAHDWDPDRPPIPVVRMPDGSTLAELPTVEELEKELGIKASAQAATTSSASLLVTTDAHDYSPTIAWASSRKSAASMLASMQIRTAVGCTFMTADNVLGRDADPWHPDWQENYEELPNYWQEQAQLQTKVVAEAAVRVGLNSGCEGKKTVAEVRSEVEQMVGKGVPLNSKVGAASTLSQKHVDPQLYKVAMTDVSGHFFKAARHNGLVVFDIFGGLGSGLEMALRRGFPIAAYYYCDSDPLAREVMKYRLATLQLRFPYLLHPSSYQNAFSLPQDVRDIREEHLSAIGENHRLQQWLVVAGWPCQDLSMAGKQAGIRGNRSKALFRLLDLLRCIQRHNPLLPPGILLENVDFRQHADYGLVLQLLGEPCTVDAAQFGSRAHRVRRFWTNLADTQVLEQVLRAVERPSGLLVNT